MTRTVTVRDLHAPPSTSTKIWTGKTDPWRTHHRQCSHHWSERYGPACALASVILGLMLIVISCTAPFLPTPWVYLLIPQACCGLLSIVCLAITNAVDPGTISAKCSLSMDAYWVPAEKAKVAHEQKDPPTIKNWRTVEKIELLPNEPSSRIVTFENKKRIKQKWCYTCHLWRPPQASHCQYCDRCMYRFDHHCGVVGNCIAFANHRFFASFLFTANLCWVLSIVLSICQLLRLRFLKDPSAWNHGEVYPLILFVLLSVPHIVILITFSSFHCCLVCTNSTTYENIKGGSYKENKLSCLRSCLMGFFAPIRRRKPIVSFFQWSPIPEDDHLSQRSEVIEEIELVYAQNSGPETPPPPIINSEAQPKMLETMTEMQEKHVPQSEDNMLGPESKDTRQALGEKPAGRSASVIL